MKIDKYFHLYGRKNDVVFEEVKWIPVSERLPKPWQEVLTTYEYNGRRFVQTAEYAGQDDENGRPLFCSSWDEYAPNHYKFVYVAWMPLPTAYKEEIKK